LNFVTGGHPTSDVWAIHEHLMSIGYTKDLTALHFMMDLGFPVIKPDIVITRLFLEWGWLRMVVPNLPGDLSPDDLRGKGKYRQRFEYVKPNMYKAVIELARQIVGVTSQEELIADTGWATENPLREFDIFTVTYGQVPDNEWGVMRTLYEGGASVRQCTLSSALAGESVEVRVDRVLGRWRQETAYLSSSSLVTDHALYRELIGIGAAALPFLLRDLERTRDGHLSKALTAITGVHPVRPEDRGYIRTIAETWLRWAKENGYRW
jgi:hypothetical protein